MTGKIPKQTCSAWEGLPEALTEKLLRLRGLILDIASADPDIGPLEETLKWGQPAFLTSDSGSGTTVRIHRHKQSTETLTFDGKRAVVFDVNDDLPVDAVRHCIAMALTYHL